VADHPSPSTTGETVHTSAQDIVRLIRRIRVDLSTEKRMQADIEQAFIAASIAFEREKRLSPEDIPDFLVQGGIVVECKVKGARKMDIYQQLRRYAVHPDVTAIILASNVAMGLPGDIEGKPLYAANLSAGWL